MLRSAGLLCALVATHVWAQPSANSRWGLRWSAEPSCIQAGPLARAVEARLGRTVFGPEPEVVIDGTAGAASPKGWRAQLTLVDAKGMVLGSREVRSDEAAYASPDQRLVLVIAVMIDPNAAFSTAPAPPRAAPPEPQPDESFALPEMPAPEPLPALQPPRPAPLASAFVGAATADAPATRVSVSFGAGVDTGAFNALTPEFAVGLRWGFESWALQLRSSVMYAAFERDGGKVVQVGGPMEADGCIVDREWGAWRAGACAGPSVALALASSQGFQQTRTAASGRVDAMLRSQLARAFPGGFRLHLGLSAGVGAFRSQVRVLRPNGTALDTPMGALFHAGVEVGLGLGS